jgi:predicted RNA-binding Zn ribbon-like protein
MRTTVSFDTDQLEAMTGCVELVNTGRNTAGDQLRTVADLQALADRYAFSGSRGRLADLAALRGHRARLDAIAVACEAGRHAAAIARLNALLAQTGATPQIAQHHGRGPHIHVSSASSPLADRMAAHFAMGLVWLVVGGEAGRLRSCASPGCNDVFVDLSRNRSRRYCDSKTCGNRMHVAAYRARKAGGNDDAAPANRPSSAAGRSRASV